MILSTKRIQKLNPEQQLRINPRFQHLDCSADGHKTLLNLIKPICFSNWTLLYNQLIACPILKYFLLMFEYHSD